MRGSVSRQLSIGIGDWTCSQEKHKTNIHVQRTNPNIAKLDLVKKKMQNKPKAGVTLEMQARTNTGTSINMLTCMHGLIFYT